MRRKVLIAVALLAVGAVAFYLWRFLAIDDCLDRGGAWLVNESRCEL